MRSKNLTQVTTGLPMKDIASLPRARYHGHHFGGSLHRLLRYAHDHRRIKTNTSMAKPFCELIRKHNMEDKILVASFHDDRLKEFRNECPEVATSSAKNETTVFVLLTKPFLGSFYSPKFFSLQVPEESGGITIINYRICKSRPRTQPRC